MRNQSHVANPAALTLPDTITELDLFAPILGPDELLFGAAAIADPDQTVLDWGTSQVLPGTLVDEPDDQDGMLLDDDEIDLELEYDAPTDLQADRSLEVGRRAESAQPDRLDNTTVLDLLDDQLSARLDFDDAPLDLDVPMDDLDKTGGYVAAQLHERPDDASDPRFHRESMSPLSELAPEDEAELERTFKLARQSEDNASVQAPQRVKRRKVLQNDVTTELNNTQIRAQQDDRSKTLKDPNFLPRDPMLLTLMHMQKSGGFVSNILGNGRSLRWAPELREVLSLDIVRRAGDLKRKRAASPAPEEQENGQEDAVMSVDDLSPEHDVSDQPMPFDELPLDDVQPDTVNSPAPNFDETTVPLVHPADSGPVSLATKHAVHLLREQFGTGIGEAPSPGTRAQQSVMFTDLCPESRTSRIDATKFFFETLVLGTKDAIKVEQGEQELGGPIKIRGKRGLWGEWAETGISQTQTQPATQTPAVVELAA